MAGRGNRNNGNGKPGYRADVQSLNEEEKKGDGRRGGGERSGH